MRVGIARTMPSQIALRDAVRLRQRNHGVCESGEHSLAEMRLAVLGEVPFHLDRSYGQKGGGSNNSESSGFRNAY